MKIANFICIKLILLLAGLFGLSAVHAQGLEFTPGSLNFTNTVAGIPSSEQTVSVTFIQSPPAAMSLNVLSMGPPNDPAFNVTSNTCPTGSYTPYVPCEVKFTFTPPATPGPVNASFSFATTEFGNLNITLRGNSAGALLPSPQTITFTSTAPTNATVGGATYDVTATGGGSGNPVVYSIDSSAASICSINNRTVSFLAQGTCVVNADQAGNTSYLPAPQAQQSFAVSPAPLTPQSITFTSTPPSPAYVGSSYDPIATGGASGNPVTFTIDPAASGICDISGNTISFTTPGSCIVLANQAGNAAFEPAAQVSQSFVITSAPKTPPAGAPTPVPTLSQWGLMLLASLLGSFAFLRQRRKS